MPITATTLTAALRKRYGSGPVARRTVLRQLGLDENMLPPTVRGGNEDPLKNLRLELERLLAELHLPDGHHAKVLDLLDRHAPLEAGDADPPLTSASPKQNEGNGLDEDDEEQRIKQFAEFLRQKGFAAADIATALDIARGGGTAKDRLPVSGLPSAGGRGGYLSGKSRGADLAELRENAEKIEGERGRYSGAMDAVKAPSRHQKSRFNARFGDARRINTGIDDDVPAADLRSSAEKKFPGMERIGV